MSPYGGFNMKRILILSLILLVFISACSSENNDDFFGDYVFEEVSYLSPLLSSTKDFVSNQMEGTKFLIREDLFKIESKDYIEEYSSPKYVKEEISEDSSLLSDVYNLIASDLDYQYTILDKNENKTYWRLYVSSNNLWIAKYNDRTKNGSEIIMYVYKLSL